MKTTIKLLSVLILLMCTLFADSQDSTTYKVKLVRFERKEHNGKSLIISGAVSTMLGGLFILESHSMLIKGDKASDDYFNSSPPDPEKHDKAQGYYDKKDTFAVCAIATIGAGVFGIIYGTISNSNGKRKAKEYQIKLDNLRTGFYYNPDQVGLKIAFKF